MKSPGIARAILAVTAAAVSGCGLIDDAAELAARGGKVDGVATAVDDASRSEKAGTATARPSEPADTAAAVRDEAIDRGIEAFVEAQSGNGDEAAPAPASVR